VENTANHPTTDFSHLPAIPDLFYRQKAIDNQGNRGLVICIVN